MFREGLRLVLEQEAGFTVVGQAGSASEAIECAHRTRADLVVLDIHLPDGNGIAVAKQLLAALPKTRILILSADPNLEQVYEALQVGVSGYLLKEEAAVELVRAVQTALVGRVYLCPAVTTALAQDLKMRPRLADSLKTKPLSGRELQVLKLMVEGLRNKEIGARLGVGTKSVETYRARLMTKLGCPSTAELVRYAVREGIAPL
jgi:DNA-binding NarL/FixJ family response regulator